MIRVTIPLSESSRDILAVSVRSAIGRIEKSSLKSDPKKGDSRGGATYFWGMAEVELEECSLEGYLGVHAIGCARAVAKKCTIAAPGGCFCTTDPEPVQSTIIAEQCTWSGKKTALHAGSTFKER